MDIQEKREKIKAMRKAGKKYDDIAKEFKISTSYAWHLVNDKDVPRSQPVAPSSVPTQAVPQAPSPQVETKIVAGNEPITVSAGPLNPESERIVAFKKEGLEEAAKEGEGPKSPAPTSGPQKQSQNGDQWTYLVLLLPLAVLCLAFLLRGDIRNSLQKSLELLKTRLKPLQNSGQ